MLSMTSRDLTGVAAISESGQWTRYPRSQKEEKPRLWKCSLLTSRPEGQGHYYTTGKQFSLTPRPRTGMSAEHFIHDTECSQPPGVGGGGWGEPGEDPGRREAKEVVRSQTAGEHVRAGRSDPKAPPLSLWEPKLWGRCGRAGSHAEASPDCTPTPSSVQILLNA